MAADLGSQMNQELEERLIACMDPESIRHHGQRRSRARSSRTAGEGWQKDTRGAGHKALPKTGSKHARARDRRHGSPSHNTSYGKKCRASRKDFLYQEQVHLDAPCVVKSRTPSPECVQLMASPSMLRPASPCRDYTDKSLVTEGNLHFMYEETLIPLGMKVISYIDDEEITRHELRLTDRSKYSLARQFGCRNKDELLVIGKKALVNKPNEEVLTAFIDQDLDQRVTLIFRRREKNGYSYFTVSSYIVFDEVEEWITLERRELEKSSVPSVIHIEYKYQSTCKVATANGMYWKNENPNLAVKPLTQGSEYVFTMYEYDAVHTSRGSVFLAAFQIDGCWACADQSGTVKLKSMNIDYQNPGKEVLFIMDGWDPLTLESVYTGTYIALDDACTTVILKSFIKRDDRFLFRCKDSAISALTASISEATMLSCATGGWSCEASGTATEVTESRWARRSCRNTSFGSWQIEDKCRKKSSTKSVAELQSPGGATDCCTFFSDVFDIPTPTFMPKRNTRFSDTECPTSLETHAKLKQVRPIYTRAPSFDAKERPKFKRTLSVTLKEIEGLKINLSSPT